MPFSIPAEQIVRTAEDAAAIFAFAGILGIVCLTWIAVSMAIRRRLP